MRSWWNDITFANPEFLWLLLLLPVLFVWYIFKTERYYITLTFSAYKHLSEIKPSLKIFGRHSLIGLRLLSFTALIIALARPQSALSWQNVSTQGIDIVIALDISSSMLAEDFKPNRLEAAKSVASDFVRDRINDRIGLVVFSGESFTQCPLTTDHDVLQNLFKDIRNGMIEDGTAIGMGLATSVNRLKESEAKSKIVILLTDGENTAGSIPPLTAAEIAKSFGVRVYTVGVGTIGMAPYPFEDMFGRRVYKDVEVKIDEKTLKGIAEITGGNYFRATGNKSLKEVYEEIDQLEKTKIDVTEYSKKKEEFLPLALIAALLLLLEQLLRISIYKSISV